MSSKMQSIVNSFVDAVKKTGGSEGSYDTAATVKRVENGTAYVSIPGGAKETPVKLTMDAKPGDEVQVRVSGHRAWLQGNATAPPTDDTTANYATNTARAAQKTADKAEESAEEAQKTADVAYEVAGSAKEVADNTEQHFWFTQTGEDTGAHITEKSQESFLEDPDNGGANLLARSNGIAVRDGLNELASFTGSGSRIGYSTARHVDIRPDSMDFYDNDSSVVGSINTAAGEDTKYVYTSQVPRAYSGINETLGSEIILNQGEDWININVLIDRMRFKENVIQYIGKDSDYVDNVYFHYSITEYSNDYVVVESDPFDVTYTNDQGVTTIIGSSFIRIRWRFRETYQSKTNRLDLQVFILPVEDSYETSWIATDIEGEFGYGYTKMSTKFPTFLFGKKSKENTSGAYSFQAGLDVYAEDVGDIALGKGVETVADLDDQGDPNDYVPIHCALGRYNVLNENRTSNKVYLLVVGNGSDDSNRSNALTLDSNGNLIVGGNIYDSSSNVLSNKLDKPTSSTPLYKKVSVQKTFDVAANSYTNTAFAPASADVPSGYTRVGLVGWNTASTHVFISTCTGTTITFCNKSSSKVTCTNATIDWLYIKTTF